MPLEVIRCPLPDWSAVLKVFGDMLDEYERETITRDGSAVVHPEKWRDVAYWHS